MKNVFFSLFFVFSLSAMESFAPQENDQPQLSKTMVSFEDGHVLEMTADAARESRFFTALMPHASHASDAIKLPKIEDHPCDVRVLFVSCLERIAEIKKNNAADGQAAQQKIADIFKGYDMELLAYLLRYGSVFGAESLADASRTEIAHRCLDEKLHLPLFGHAALQNQHIMPAWYQAMCFEDKNAVVQKIAEMRTDLTVMKKNSFIGLQGPVETACFGHDGSRVFMGMRDGSINIWSRARGDVWRIQRRFKLEESSVSHIAVSRDGKRMLVLHQDGRVCVVQPGSQGGTVVRRWDYDQGPRYGVFSPQGDRLIIAEDCTQSDIYAFNSVTNDWDYEGTVDCESYGQYPDFNADGTQVVIEDQEDIVIYCFDAQSREWKEDAKIATNCSNYKATFIGDGSQIMIASSSGVVFWNKQQGRWVEQDESLEGAEVEGVDYDCYGRTLWASLNGNGTRIATTSDDGSTRLWHKEGENWCERFIQLNNKIVDSSDSPYYEGQYVALDSSGAHMLSLDEAGNVALWSEVSLAEENRALGYHLTLDSMLKALQDMQVQPDLFAKKNVVQKLYEKAKAEQQYVQKKRDIYQRQLEHALLMRQQHANKKQKSILG